MWHDEASMVLADIAFRGLMAVRFAAGCPEDACGEDGDDDGDNEERGRDVHG
jgi:hypothetical protein